MRMMNMALFYASIWIASSDSCADGLPAYLVVGDHADREANCRSVAIRSAGIWGMAVPGKAQLRIINLHLIASGPGAHSLKFAGAMGRRELHSRFGLID
jgi:hypothetical protein